MIWPFSGIGRWISGALVALAAVLGIFHAGRREGAQKAVNKAREADQKNARNIEERADEALRKHDGDTRPVDERLRDRSRLRDGD